MCRDGRAAVKILNRNGFIFRQTCVCRAPRRQSKAGHSYVRAPLDKSVVEEMFVSMRRSQTID